MKKVFYSMLAITISSLLIASCVPTRKYRDSQSALQSVRADSAALAGRVATLQSEVGQLKQQIGDLNKKVADLNNQAGMLSSDAANKQSQLNMSKEELANQQRR